MRLRVTLIFSVEMRCSGEAWVVTSHQMHDNHSNVILWNIGRLCWWIVEDWCVDNNGVHEKRHRRSHLSVRGRVFMKTNSSWYWSSVDGGDGEGSWFSWYVRKHKLYTLGMEELSNRLEVYLCKRYIQSSYNHSWGSCFVRPLGMACLL